MIHWLKTAQSHFEEIWEGRKTSELRSTQDREFEIDTILILGEATMNARANRAVIVRVTHVLPVLERQEAVLSFIVLGKISEDSLQLFTYHTITLESEQWGATQRKE